MKIPLSESHTADVMPEFRSIYSTKSTLLLANLLEAKSDREYRKAATNLRFHLQPKNDSKTTKYPCLHPDWFDDYAKKDMVVDATTCRMCGYGQDCTLGQDNRDYVEIVSLDNSRIPSKKYFQESCFTAYDKNGMIVIDPFLGFSSRAGKTRKLYIISQDEFSKRFPSSNSNYEFDSSIGYDRCTGQSIWPIDQLFLQQYELISGKLNFEIIGDKNIFDNELSIIDQNCLLKVAYENGWLLQSDADNVKLGIKILFSRLIKTLKLKEIYSQMHNILLLSMIPKIDIPYNCSGSGYLNIAMRWAELKPNDLESYRQSLELGKEVDLVQDLLLGRIIKPLFKELNKGAVQYLPRFPMIAISPSKLLKNIEFEHSVGKVIDVAEYIGDEILLLIDSLGFDLSVGGEISD